MRSVEKKLIYGLKLRGLVNQHSFRVKKKNVCMQQRTLPCELRCRLNSVEKLSLLAATLKMFAVGVEL